MCGIFGYKGTKSDAHKRLLHGLGRLEYRGYDSAGLVVFDKNQNHKIVKSVGKVSSLATKASTEFNDNQEYFCGISHTRWATHGNVTQPNAHPHHDTKQEVFIVHNGIIENYQELKKELQKQGYEFYSETDTEIIAKLIESARTGELLETLEIILPLIEGAYALLAISKNDPEQMIGVKYGSPLVFGYTEEGDFYFSSDTQALAGYVDNVIYLDDGDLVCIKNNDYFIKSEGKLKVKAVDKIDVQSLQTDKGDYTHYMLKEIFEQPEVLKDVFRGRVDFNDKMFYAYAFDQIKDLDFNEVVFIGCGTASYAGLLGSYWMNSLAGMKASSEIASEMEYKNIKVDDKTLYVFISQSGETADSIDVLKMIKAKGGKTFGVVNVVGSTISRMTDYGMFVRAGTEIGVASTKAFTAQIAVCLILALYFGKKKELSNIQLERLLGELKLMSDKMTQILSKSDEIRKIAKNLINYKNFFYIGRNLQMSIAQEGSLKLKEISYLHSEAYPAGELKHGPIALIDENFPTILLAPNDWLYEKNISSMQEIKARKGKILAISDREVEGADWQIHIPNTAPELYPFLTVVASQLLAYHVADLLGHDIDKPRNLAKSVTVK